jgi:hypothetical protein
MGPITNAEEPWQDRVQRWLKPSGPGITRQQMKAAALLGRHSAELEALPQGIGAAIAREWLGVMEVQMYADDELVYSDYDPPDHAIEDLLKVIALNATEPVLRHEKCVAGLAFVAITPHGTPGELIAIHRDLFAKFSQESALKLCELASRELGNFGLTDVAVPWLDENAGSPLFPLMLQGALEAAVHRYSVMREGPSRYERCISQLATICEALSTHYNLDEAAELIGSPVGKHITRRFGMEQSLPLVMTLLTRGVRPMSRVISEVLRLAIVEPRSFALELANAVQQHDVFISHMGSDKPLARAIGEALRSRDLSVWLDEWVMRPGDVLSEQIARGIESSKYFLILLSQAALEQDWVRYELELALVRQVGSKERYIVPILLDDAKPPFAIRHLLYHRMSDGEPIHDLCDRLQL